LNVLAYCRLAGEKLLGGLGETFFPVDGNKNLQVTCLDGWIPLVNVNLF
jgi:hypothetical protein